MACLNCVNCLGYENGKFGVVLDPDGNIVANGNDELVLNTNAAPLVADTAIADDIVAGCDNGIFSDGDDIWIEPTPCVETFSDSFTGFSNAPFTGQNEQVFTLGTFLNLPAADPCYPTKYVIGVSRWVRTDQIEDTDYGVDDIVGGVLNADQTSMRSNINGIAHFSRLQRGWIHNLTRPAGSGAFGLGFQIRVRSFGQSPASNTGFVYDYGWYWNVLKFAAKG